MESPSANISKTPRVIRLPLMGSANFLQTTLHWEKCLPDISHWSEVTGILWRSLAGKDVGLLKHIVFINVVGTNNAMRAAASHYAKRNKLASNWRYGEYFNPEKAGKAEDGGPLTLTRSDPEFFAVLNTPHGTAVNFLVKQNEDIMFGKIITSMILLAERNNHGHFQEVLVFTLDTLPEPPANKGPTII